MSSLEIQWKKLIKCYLTERTIKEQIKKTNIGSDIIFKFLKIVFYNVKQEVRRMFNRREVQEKKLLQWNVTSFIKIIRMERYIVTSGDFNRKKGWDVDANIFDFQFSSTVLEFVSLNLAY